MKTMLISIIYELIMLVFSTLQGLAIMPEALKESADGEDVIVPFFFAPLIGFSVYNAVSYFAGNILPYDRLLVILLFALAVAVIVLRRKHLFLIRDKVAWGYILVLTVLSFFAIYSCIPHEIDGGMYFMGSAFDHQRTALIDSIALAGFPLRLPWLADGGNPIIFVNHCGLHTVMAQPVILFGMPSFAAGGGIEGLAFVVMMLTVGALAYQLTRKKITWVFLILVFLISAPGDTLVKYASPFWKGLLAPGEYYNGVGYDGFFGFWPLNSDMLWAPHCALSAAITLFLIYLYCILLGEEDKTRAIHIAVIMGSMAAAAFVGNVYSGMMALFIFILSLVPVYIFSKGFRTDFNAALKYQVIVVIVGLLLAAPFFYSLFFMGDSINVETVYGVLPPFDSAKGFGIVIAFLEFTLITLTARCGLPQLLGIIAMAVPGVLPKNRFVKLTTIYFLIVSVVIFFCSSSFYSNDLGWRTPYPVRLFCLIGTAILLAKCFHWLYAKRAALGYALLAAVACLIAIFPDVLVQDLTPEYVADRETHVAFAKAAEGWKDIRKNTEKTDLVLCNPKAFSEITYNYVSDSYNSYLFSYFAGRFSAVADITLSKSIISDEDLPRYEALYQFAVDFFDKEPTGEDVRYVAEEMKVKAILVTPDDALWDSCDALSGRYDLRSQTDGYKVFIFRE